MDNLTALLGFDMDAFETEFKQMTVAPAQTTKNSVREGRYVVKYKGTSRSFYYLEPEEMLKEEKKRKSSNSHILEGIILGGEFGMQVWGAKEGAEGQGLQGPARPEGVKGAMCRSVSYVQGNKENNLSARKKGNPPQATMTKDKFVRHYDLMARRYETSFDTTTGKMDGGYTEVRCTDCALANEEIWFQACKQQGYIQMLVLKADGDPVTEPFIAHFDMSLSSVISVNNYLKELFNRGPGNAPGHVITSMTVEGKEGPTGAPYDVLVFKYVMKATQENRDQLNEAIGKLPKIEVGELPQAPPTPQLPAISADDDDGDIPPF